MSVMFAKKTSTKVAVDSPCFKGYGDYGRRMSIYALNPYRQIASNIIKRGAYDQNSVRRIGKKRPGIINKIINL